MLGVLGFEADLSRVRRVNCNGIGEDIVEARVSGVPASGDEKTLCGVGLEMELLCVRRRMSRGRGVP